MSTAAAEPKEVTALEHETKGLRLALTSAEKRDSTDNGEAHDHKGEDNHNCPDDSLCIGHELLLRKKTERRISGRITDGAERWNSAAAEGGPLQ
ncbi:hypothetical protein [Paludibacterium denitrificans]|uniref:Uncharacterized protein n=1 Tax=Paludibacterium denitrificans TaxID=2675226 RepID=A0A844GDC1_9NEIS|nr:hypothetical protein [Paludibacterium denitrificans]MTD33271.1 hypothetical protein [Paludibacterium denitrificans]